MAEEIPAEAYQLAVVNQLGTPIAAYKINYSREDRLFLLRFFATLFVFVLVIALLIYFYLYNFSGHKHVFSSWPTLLIILLNLILISFQRFGRLRKGPPINFFIKDLRIYTYTEGLLYIRKRKTDVIRWNEIRLMQNNISMKDRLPICLSIHRKDRKVFAFPCELPGIDELAHTIEREYARHRYRQ